MTSFLRRIIAVYVPPSVFVVPIYILELRRSFDFIVYTYLLENAATVS